MLFEMAYLDKNGNLIRSGGVAANIRTIGKWIEKYAVEYPEFVFVALPANNDAITIDELKRRRCSGYYEKIEE